MIKCSITLLIHTTDTSTNKSMIICTTTYYYRSSNTISCSRYKSMCSSIIWLSNIDSESISCYIRYFNPCIVIRIFWSRISTNFLIIISSACKVDRPIIKLHIITIIESMIIRCNSHDSYNRIIWCINWC